MASGFGTFNSSNYVTVGSQRAYARAKVSQSVNQTARTVTITVKCFLACYRVSGNWTVPSGTSIFNNTRGSNTIQATLDGSTSTAGAGGKLGLKGTGKNISAGNWYDTEGVVESGKRVYYVAANSYAETTKSTTFNYNSAGNAITKSWSVKISYSGTTMTCSGNVTTDSISPQGNPPSDYSVSDIIPDWDRITFTSIVGNTGGLNLTEHSPSVRMDASHIATTPKYQDTRTGSNVSATITTTITNGSSKIYNPTWTIQGCGYYYCGAWVINSAGEMSPQGQGSGTYTPPAPCILNVSSASEGYNINFTGDTSKNNSDYDAASLTRTVRYKVDNGNWIYLENNTQRAIDYLTTNSILESYVFQIVVQGWMTYHNLDSVISEYIIEPPGKDYKAMGPGIGKFDNSAVNFDKMYIAQSSVTKKLDKLYISVRGKTRRIF